jgi:hypothetical protein
MLKSGLRSYPAFVSHVAPALLLCECTDCDLQHRNTVMVIAFISFHFPCASSASTLDLCALFAQVLGKRNNFFKQLSAVTPKGRRVADFEMSVCIFEFERLAAALAFESSFIQLVREKL